MMSQSRSHFWLSLSLLFSMLVSGCSGLPNLGFATPTPQAALPTATPAPTSTSTATPLPSATPSSTPEPNYFVWLAPYLPQAFVDGLNLPGDLLLTSHLTSADYMLEVDPEHPLSQWVYALVAPFPTVEDGISLENLMNFWGGTGSGLFTNRPLVMDESSYQMFALIWGVPADSTVKILPTDELLDYAWNNQPAWAIVAFETLEPRWKVLEVDRVTPLDAGFDPQTYPLTVPIALKAMPSAPVPVEDLQVSRQATNYDASKFTRVALTGVTALVRGTAITMDAKGVLYPAEEIGGLLRSADITHISNEIPFYSQCPKPVMYPTEIRFCSDPSYFALLQNVGADVIELTGDHFGDYGVEAMQETLAVYKENNLPYYGGGANSIEARQAVTFENHGNKIAFIGCNAKGLSFYASATETAPGAVPCDLDWMSGEITRLKAEGYLVITTFQHIEYYTYDPDPLLKEDMQQVARAGAVIVSGSQAHQPHGMTFLDGSFIHYGLGNLFFDQYRYFPGPELDRAFIDWHVFYNGKYISTRLITISWVDLAKVRLTTPAERTDFLKTIFDASHWEPGKP